APRDPGRPTDVGGRVQQRARAAEAWQNSRQNHVERPTRGESERPVYRAGGQRDQRLGGGARRGLRSARRRGAGEGEIPREFSIPKPGRRVPNPDVPGAWLEEPIETLPARYHRDSKYVLEYDPDDPKPYDAELTSP